MLLQYVFSANLSCPLEHLGDTWWCTVALACIFNGSCPIFLHRLEQSRHERRTPGRVAEEVLWHFVWHMHTWTDGRCLSGSPPVHSVCMGESGAFSGRRCQPAQDLLGALRCHPGLGRPAQWPQQLRGERAARGAQPEEPQWQVGVVAEPGKRAEPAVRAEDDAGLDRGGREVPGGTSRCQHCCRRCGRWEQEELWPDCRSFHICWQSGTPPFQRGGQRCPLSRPTECWRETQRLGGHPLLRLHCSTTQFIPSENSAWTFPTFWTECC